MGYSTWLRARYGYRDKNRVKEVRRGFQLLAALRLNKAAIKGLKPLAALRLNKGQGIRGEGYCLDWGSSQA